MRARREGRARAPAQLGHRPAEAARLHVVDEGLDGARHRAPVDGRAEREPVHPAQVVAADGVDRPEAHRRVGRRRRAVGHQLGQRGGPVGGRVVAHEDVGRAVCSGRSGGWPLVLVLLLLLRVLLHHVLLLLRVRLLGRRGHGHRPREQLAQLPRTLLVVVGVVVVSVPGDPPARRLVQRVGLVGEHAAHDAHVVEGRLRGHLGRAHVDLVGPARLDERNRRAVEHGGESRPADRGHAHGARLGGRVQLEARRSRVDAASAHGAQVGDGAHLAMPDRIVRRVVGALGYDRRRGGVGDESPVGLLPRCDRLSGQHDGTTHEDRAHRGIGRRVCGGCWEEKTQHDKRSSVVQWQSRAVLAPAPTVLCRRVGA